MTDTAMNQVRISDIKLAEWLRSNPVAECCNGNVPVIGLKHQYAFLRWPIVPEQELNTWAR